MLNRKRCPNCKGKISEKFYFCPTCGIELNNKKMRKDWGMLGIDELDASIEEEFPNLFGGIGGKLIEKILNSTIKMVEKEMEKSMKNENKGIPSNFELYINGKRIPPEKIKITNQKIGNNQKKNSEINEEEKLKRVSFSQENKNLFLKLEKKEPSTSIRRLSNKIIYELNVPGVESINDISIIQLENSIEIKAIGKKFGYEKILPVSFPISNYYISEGKLILELKEN